MINQSSKGFRWQASAGIWSRHFTWALRLTPICETVSAPLRAETFIQKKVQHLETLGPIVGRAGTSLLSLATQKSSLSRYCVRASPSHGYPEPGEVNLCVQ
jgi:hypothetical protein